LSGFPSFSILPPGRVLWAAEPSVVKCGIPIRKNLPFWSALATVHASLAAAVKLRSSWLFLLIALVVIGAAFDFITRSRLSATSVLQCQGEYGDSLQLQSMRTRETEQGPRGQYSYLVRSTARYECPFFGPDGKLRRRRTVASELGSAFAYEVDGNETFLLTNEHVASWPEVTDGLHRVDGVPEGCKRVEDKLRIVRDERDDFEPGQIPLTRIAVDPLLDAAVLKAPQVLKVIPYKIGKSASLREGNAIRVRGFPLGVMQAVSDGKIVNPYDRDQEQGWDHVDFVVDALLSEGNSGSPVLAVACATRELQLVGMYHAGYKGHSALNVVVGIDQLGEFMRRKKRVPRTLTDAGSGLGVKERARLIEALGKSSLPLFDFGGTTIRVEDHEGILAYHFYGKQFPLDDRRALVIEDLPKEGTFGEVGRLFVPGPSIATGTGPWRAWPPPALGSDERDLVARTVDSLRVQVQHALDYRHALANPSSADDRKRGRDLSRSIGRDAVLARDLSGSLLEMTERLMVGRETPAPPSGSTTSDAPPLPPPPPGPGLPAQPVAVPKPR
jgi:S1-C subfamily serine protease